MSMEVAHEKAAKGAALLDEDRPTWRERVNRHLLDMSLESHCVLGQVYGEYFHGVTALGLTTHQQVANGFLTSVDAGGPDDGTLYSELQEA